MVCIRSFRALTKVGAMIIASVFIFVLGISTNASAGDTACYSAVKKYEALLVELKRFDHRLNFLQHVIGQVFQYHNFS